MPILYEDVKKLQPCKINCQVVQKNGSPCPFASITVFKVWRFLWWDILLYETSTTANFYGKATVTLQKGVRYRFRVRWTGAEGKTREWWEPLIPTICPYTMTLTAPW